MGMHTSVKLIMCSVLCTVQTINQLGRKARDGTISIDEMAGGTFTISNGGVYGSMLSTPIINPPQSAILGMHNITQRAMVVNGKIEARPMMYIALTYDHRLIDGREVSFHREHCPCVSDVCCFPSYALASCLHKNTQRAMVMIGRLRHERQCIIALVYDHRLMDGRGMGHMCAACLLIGPLLCSRHCYAFYLYIASTTQQLHHMLLRSLDTGRALTCCSCCA
eukprot:GHRR01007327.1.p1 GENE.GHRR01007327.1~~GHRR01007327.1.p1  ORF type:complete len:222 (+),score=26.76 GHRR01007327.1:1641-2306(+)